MMQRECEEEMRARRSESEGGDEGRAQGRTVSDSFLALCPKAELSEVTASACRASV